MEDFINLSVSGVSYDGPRSMVQFEVESMEMILKDPNYLVIEIKLKRMFKYHLAATYVPSALLIIITTITLFVDEKHYGATIMVHLTTMLVMFTLYQSVSDSMPKTAYLKFIDIWLLYGIIVPFVTFIVETILILLAVNDDVDGLYATVVKLHPVQRRIQVAPTPESTSNREQRKMGIEVRKITKEVIKYASQIIIPLATMTFFITYAYLAYAQYD